MSIGDCEEGMVTATQNTRQNRKKCLPPFARAGKSISGFLFGVASLRCAIVLACTLALGSLGVADTTSSITAHFNGTANAGGHTMPVNRGLNALRRWRDTQTDIGPHAVVYVPAQVN